MSAFTRWEPLKGQWNVWKDMDEMEQRLSTYLRQPARLGGDQETMTVAEWTPLVDISEDQSEYLITVELPGIKTEDVKLTVQNQVLCLSGKRPSEPADEGKTYHRMERAYGSFIRSFSLPEDIAATHVTAEYKDGILTIHVPKTKMATPHDLDVQAA